jgi:dihydrofolate synthase / folylpolyglutamate synthase
VSLARVLGELYARVPLGMRLGLDAMNAACEVTGHPERAFECVHVAGTNGKGSVCAMVESIARAAGKKTGLYTSPHLVKLAERIRVDGEPIADDALEAVLAKALAVRPELSFFETVTLAAFLAFREAKVDLAVIEVGIGGRLDATNVIPPPRVAAITRIAFDHMDKLGGTLVEIAREKAAIAKPGVTMVLGKVDRPVRAAIDAVAHAAGATTVDAEGDDESGLSWMSGTSPLLGAHQWGNRAVAYRIARELGVDEETIVKGLRAVRWPGRLERIDASDGPYLLDGAHNPDGAAALAQYLQPAPKGSHGLVPGAFLGDAEVALVFGALADKAWPEMLDLLAPVTTRRVYAEPHGRAAVPPAELAKRHPGATAKSLAEALGRARALVGDRGVVVVCGSLYLVGEARALLLGLESDPPVAL